MNRPASRPRAFSDDRSTPPPEDWWALVLACMASLALALLAFVLWLAWPLL